MNRRSIFLFLASAALLLLLQACTVKRDCQGRVKHKLPNGIWM